MTLKSAKSPFAKSTATGIFCLSLVACGGGRGDAPVASGAAGAGSSGQLAALPTPVTTAVQAPPTSPTMLTTSTIPTSTPAARSTPAGDVSCGLNGAAGIQAEVLQRLNALRSLGAVCGSNAFAATGPLTWSNQLLQTAIGHSNDMARKNYVAHTSLDGRTPAQRVTAAGYSWSAVGENIAAGQRSVEEVMTGWTQSPGHCQNLINPNFREVAVACVRNDASTYSFYWSMELGAQPLGRQAE